MCRHDCIIYFYNLNFFECFFLHRLLRNNITQHYRFKNAAIFTEAATILGLSKLWRYIDNGSIFSFQSQ